MGRPIAVDGVRAGVCGRWGDVVLFGCGEGPVGGVFGVEGVWCPALVGLGALWARGLLLVDGFARPERTLSQSAQDRHPHAPP